MKHIFALLAALVCFAPPASAQTLALTGPDREGMLEGEDYAITWTASGVESVSVVAEGTRTPLGARSRGVFAIPVADAVPAGQEWVTWIVPWIDSADFTVKAKGYDSSGRLVATSERQYHFRPAVLAQRQEDGIYLDLHEPSNQRIYVQKDGRITRAYISTSSENYAWRPPGSHVRSAHDHAGVFQVLEKKRSHYSTLFHVQMPYAMRYHGGHFIHATSRNLYDTLGTPASAGCNRLTLHDARELYRNTIVGTRVEVIGPEG